jgi:hypothetical protein
MEIKEECIRQRPDRQTAAESMRLKDISFDEVSQAEVSREDADSHRRFPLLTVSLPPSPLKSFCSSPSPKMEFSSQNGVFSSTEEIPPSFPQFEAGN